MFAGAAREVVFANAEVVRRINEQFIPVALKAAHVNNPPSGIEGRLYAEINRTKPAPQGICTMNSDGKVLTWALSFDQDDDIIDYLNHVQRRFRKHAGEKTIAAERYMRFPSRKMDDVADLGKSLSIPDRHSHDEYCPGTPPLPEGTLVGSIIGRPVDSSGKPIAKTLRQEDYMESRFRVSAEAQRRLFTAVQSSNDRQFDIPGRLVRELVSSAYLGQLDVNPLGNLPRSHYDAPKWTFVGKVVPSDQQGLTRVHLLGRSTVFGRAAGNSRDSRQWEHRVSLAWQGYLDLKDGDITHLVVLANGDERLLWGSRALKLSQESDSAHLMAGHYIDLDSPVRYALTATREQ